MAHLISISEKISPSQQICNRGQVYATAEASFDRDSSCLHVKLGSFVWRPGLESDRDRAAADCLPLPMTVTESVSREDATHVTKEIFNNWLREVQRRITASPERGCDEEDPVSREFMFSMRRIHE